MSCGRWGSVTLLPDDENAKHGQEEGALHASWLRMEVAIVSDAVALNVLSCCETQTQTCKIPQIDLPSYADSPRRKFVLPFALPRCCSSNFGCLAVAGEFLKHSVQHTPTYFHHYVDNLVLLQASLASHCLQQLNLMLTQINEIDSGARFTD